MTQHLLGNISPSHPPTHASYFLLHPSAPFLHHPSLGFSGTRTSSHYISGSASPGLLPVTPPPARARPLLPRSSADSPLPRRRKVIPPSPEWWWMEQRRRKAGGGSICLVNFNAQADVSLSLCVCVLVRSVGWERVWCYDHIRECFVVLIVKGFSFMLAWAFVARVTGEKGFKVSSADAFWCYMKKKNALR